MDKLTILVNTAQWRMDKERVGITVAGTDFNIYNDQSSGVWIDPITNTVMLLPFCLTDTWHTSSAGNYSRLGLSDFGLSGDWVAKGDKSAGQTRMYLPGGGMVSSALTSSTYGVNRGFLFSFFNFAIGNDDRGVSAECGIGDSGDYTTGVSIRFRDSGRTEVWKLGEMVGEYNMGLVTGQQTANCYNDILIIPMRGRELLVVNVTNGTGFVHVFTDIDEDDASPEITPDEKFWFFFRDDRAADVEIAPLIFAETGAVASKIYSFGKLPLTGQTLEAWTNTAPATGVTDAFLYASFATGSTTEEITAVDVIEITGGGAFTPDGILDQCRVKISMAADSGQGYTPFLRGVHLAYEGTFVETDDSEEFDISSYLLSASLSVPDDPAGVQLDCTVKDPVALSADVPGLLTQENLPCKVMLGSLLLIDGVLNPVPFVDEIEGEVQEGKLIIKDRISAMQRYAIRDRIPIENWDLSKSTPASNFSFVRFMYGMIGISFADMDLENITYKIPAIPGSSSTEFGNIISPDNTPFSKFAEVVDEAAYGFLWGIIPTATGPKAIFKDPDLLSATPDIKVYRSAEDAVLDGADPADAPQLTYDSYHEEPLPIEGNELRITGLDPRYTNPMPVVAWDEDAASKDATTAPSSRPDNWCGEPRVVAYSSPRLQTWDACKRLVDQAFPKISSRRYIGGARCQCLLKSGDVPIWRGDLIDFDGQRELRISALTMEFICERDDLVFRYANYTGGALLGLGGHSVAQIRNLHRLKMDSASLFGLATSSLSGALVSVSTKV